MGTISRSVFLSVTKNLNAAMARSVMFNQLLQKTRIVSFAISGSKWNLNVKSESFQSISLKSDNSKNNLAGAEG